MMATTLLVVPRSMPMIFAIELTPSEAGYDATTVGMHAAIYPAHQSLEQNGAMCATGRARR